MPHLLIDATCLGKRISGFERYTHEIVKALTTQVENNEKMRLSILVSRNERVEGRDGENKNFSCKHPSGRVKYVSLNSSGRIIRDLFELPYRIQLLSPDVVLFPAFPPSPFIHLLPKRIRLFRTIHDVVPWRFPETLSFKYKAYFRPQESLAWSRYEKILTVSPFSERELKKQFPKDAAKIVNCGNALPSSFLCIGDEASEQKNSFSEAVKKKYKIEPGFLLFVGTIEPRKNILFLFDVLKELASINPKIRMILVGRRGWGGIHPDKMSRKYGLEKNMQWLKNVSDRELEVIYRLASVFLFPSFYEGFGYPVLEAMASGTPVLANDIEVIREMAEDAVLYRSVNSPKLWCQDTLHILNDEELRLRFVQKGRERANLYRWEVVGKRLLDFVCS